jgi:hypothetical protein
LGNVKGKPFEKSTIWEGNIQTDLRLSYGNILSRCGLYWLRMRFYDDTDEPWGSITSLKTISTAQTRLYIMDLAQ